MNQYSERMTSRDGSALLRKLMERTLNHGQRGGYPPQERFYEDFALLAYPPRDGWAVGLWIKYTADSWAIVEVAALPVAPTQTLPAVDSETMQGDAEKAVLNARERRRMAAEQLVELADNATFIQERFEAWRDKASRKSNFEYAALAAKYAEQIREGNLRATATLAEFVNMSPAVMAQRIKEARRRALLSPGEQGKASGTLTPLGVMYTNRDFPGVSRLRQAGMTQREIAEKYGIDESYVWAAVQGENFSDDDSPLLAVSPPNHGASLTADDILRRDDRGR